MNRSMFKSINRAQDLENRILLARSIAEERGTPVDSSCYPGSGVA